MTQATQPQKQTRPAPGGSFVFAGYAYDPRSGELQMNYRTEPGSNFTEIIRFPLPVKEPDADRREALDRAARLIYLLAGVSYYKTTVAGRIVCEDLTSHEAVWLRELYLKGLGEFAYRNDLNLRDCLAFAGERAAKLPVSLKGEGGYLVPVGGGKDSAVSIELLKRQKKPVVLFALASSQEPAAPIRACIEASGLPALVVERRIAPELFEANAKGAYNGHVPITAILSAIAVATAILHGLDCVVMSNEHSASAPNLVQDDLEINHQYSKSYAFETDLQSYLRETISSDLGYVSLLRPFSEAEIARRFAGLSRYHGIFRSCNTAFRQDAAARGAHWCCNCPKCRFVFLALAAFMPKDDLLNIFGANLLNDPAQQDGFAQLCGLQDFKPFECVGEIEESALLLGALARKPDWQGDTVVAALAPRLPFDESRYAALFDMKTPHAVPPALMELLDAS